MAINRHFVVHVPAESDEVCYSSNCTIYIVTDNISSPSI